MMFSKSRQASSITKTTTHASLGEQAAIQKHFSYPKTRADCSVQEITVILEWKCFLITTAGCGMLLLLIFSLP